MVIDTTRSIEPKWYKTQLRPLKEHQAHRARPKSLKRPLIPPAPYDHKGTNDN